MGIALNYKDDLRLRDTHVLNPHWVTNGIYRILNAQELAKSRGELCVRDLRHILAPREYPPARHSFLLELMRKFELCFSFPDDPERYLLPELLDEQEPPDVQGFVGGLNFQYHYPIVPEGLLPKIYRADA